MPVLWIVIPCLNEEAVLPETCRQLKKNIEKLIEKKIISGMSKILFVNDGSKDQTWNLLEKLHQEDSLFLGINLSRNFGHQNALFAGLMTAKDHADMCISMDADLQDDPQIMEAFVKAYKEGNDVVYGVRSDRKSDSLFKKNTAAFFYGFMKFLGVELIYNHGDFRLLSKRAIIALEEYTEVNVFLRGMIPMLGFPSSIIKYKRNKRFAGKTKYSLKKMFKLAFEGITSLSIRPIRVISVCGGMIFMICIIMIVYFFIRHMTGNTVNGWTSLIMSVWTLGSLQLLAIGMIGEYIGKVYLESKHRPKYIIKDTMI